MRFVAGGPDIPVDVLKAQQDGSLIFFCGAGLPNFNRELSTLNSRLSKLSNQIDIKTVRGLAPTQRNEIDDLMNVMANRYVCHT